METKGNIKSVLSTELAGYLADTGSVNAYAVALRPAITTYTTGLQITFQAATTNTGAATLAVNGLATKTIKKSATIDLSVNDIIANQIVTVVYDGTNFQMLSWYSGEGNPPVTFNDYLSNWTVPTTGNLIQPTRTTLTNAERVTLSGTGRLIPRDNVDAPFAPGVDMYQRGSFLVAPDQYLAQYQRLSLFGNARSTLTGTAQIVAFDLASASGRLTLAGRGITIAT